MSDKYDGLPPAMAEILKQDDVIKDLRHQLQQAEARIAIEEATTPQPAGDWMRCPECGSADLSWSAHATVTNGTPDGRLRANEVNTLFVLGCNYCSETIETLTSDEVARRLSETSQPDNEQENTRLQAENEALRERLENYEALKRMHRLDNYPNELSARAWLLRKQAEAVESQAKEWNPEEQTYSGRKPHKELIAEARHLRQQADELEKGV